LVEELVLEVARWAALASAEEVMGVGAMAAEVAEMAGAEEAMATAGAAMGSLVVAMARPRRLASSAMSCGSSLQRY